MEASRVPERTLDVGLRPKRRRPTPEDAEDLEELGRMLLEVSSGEADAVVRAWMALLCEERLSTGETTRSWLRTLREKGRDSDTVTAYRIDVRQFCLHLVQAEGWSGEWEEVERLALRAWIGGLCVGLEASTIQRKIAALNSVFQHLFQESLIRRNPLHGVKGPKKETRLPKPIPLERLKRTLDRMLEKARRTGSIVDFRDYTMVEFFYSTGCRLAEARGARVEDLDSSFEWCRVVGKGGKEKYVRLGGPARAAMREWLRVRKKVAAEGAAEIFVSTQSGRKLSCRGIQKRIKKWFPEGVHALRHSFATDIMNESARKRQKGDKDPLPALKDLMGHADVSTTRGYIRVSTEHLKLAYKAHPRA